MSTTITAELYMERITEIGNAIVQLQDEIHDLCVEAHDTGTLTWQQIGDTLSISRQAAWERFTQYRLGQRVRTNTRS